jgi:transcription antitermination protein NusB
VVINEAIEIAKKFCTSESSSFINGVLDRLGKELRPSNASSIAAPKA